MTHVMVIGDIMVDQFIRPFDETVKTECGGKVYDGGLELRCGGAALAAFHSGPFDVSLVGVVGDDTHGRFVKEELHRRGINDGMVVTTSSAETIVKTRVVTSDGQFRVDSGYSARLPKHIVKFLADAVLSEKPDAVLISDYQYGIWDSLRYDVSFDCPVVVDPGRTRNWSEYPSETTAITPNEVEAAGRIWKWCNVVTTKGANGVSVTTPDYTVDIPGWTSCSEHMAIGAGDVFSMALTEMLACGMNIIQAAARANMVAAGYVSCTPRKSAYKNIVFTNGCFDMLHEGHVSLLQRAKSLGEYLIVGLNDDASVARLKGSNRPVVGVDERKTMLEALACVDEVIVFSEDTPNRLLKMIAPDVLVKGGATHPVGAEVVEAYGGDVVLLPLTGSVSTTERLREAKCH